VIGGDDARQAGGRETVSYPARCVAKCFPQILPAREHDGRTRSCPWQVISQTHREHSEVPVAQHYRSGRQMTSGSCTSFCFSHSSVPYIGLYSDRTASPVTTYCITTTRITGQCDSPSWFFATSYAFCIAALCQRDVGSVHQEKSVQQSATARMPACNRSNVCREIRRTASTAIHTRA
jgi:hypothetical protein